MSSLRTTVQQAKRLLGETLRRWLDDDIGTHTASLAYSTVFSIAPTLIIATAVAGAIFGPEAARGEVRTQIGGLVGTAGAVVIEDMMVNASKPGAGLIASLLGVAMLLFGATGVFAALQTALNSIWAAPKPTRHAITSFLRTRLLSLVMVLGIGVLLLVSVVISTAISALGAVVGADRTPLALQVTNFFVSYAFVTLLFAMIYKLLPDVRVAWGDVWLGAAVTAAFFNVGKALIGMYLGGGAVATSYGATGSLAVLLIWVYSSSMVLLLGAEFTNVYSREFGSLRESTLQNPPKH